MNIPAVQLAGPPVFRPKREDVVAHLSNEGVDPDDDYVSFLVEYGSGLWAGMFVFYVPITDLGAYSWFERLEDKSSELRSDLRQLSSMGFMSAASAALVDVFSASGTTENGDTVGWIVGREGVYVHRSRSRDVERVADGFSDFMWKSISPGVGGILGNATFVLPSTFEPRPCFG